MEHLHDLRDRSSCSGTTATSRSTTLDNPLLIALIALSGIGLPLLGNLRPDKFSFLPAMRYYAGNWATT